MENKKSRKQNRKKKKEERVCAVASLFCIMFVENCFET
jgi:hypothetical protein